MNANDHGMAVPKNVMDIAHFDNLMAFSNDESSASARNGAGNGARASRHVSPVPSRTPSPSMEKMGSINTNTGKLAS